jgi:putative endonuclease
VKVLVYFEVHQEISEAIAREKRIKRWRRDWKLQLIEAKNPQWLDLWPELTMEKDKSM